MIIVDLAVIRRQNYWRSGYVSVFARHRNLKNRYRKNADSETPSPTLVILLVANGSCRARVIYVLSSVWVKLVSMPSDRHLGSHSNMRVESGT